MTTERDSGLSAVAALIVAAASSPKITWTCPACGEVMRSATGPGLLLLADWHTCPRGVRR